MQGSVYDAVGALTLKNEEKYINTYFKCTKVNLGLMFFGEGSDFNSELGKTRD